MSVIIKAIDNNKQKRTTSNFTLAKEALDKFINSGIFSND